MSGDPGWWIHSLIALAVTAATAALGWWLGYAGVGAVIGAVVASAFFGIREYCQQMRGTVRPLRPTWWPGNWGKNGKREFYWPFGSSFGLSFLIAAAGL